MHQSVNSPVAALNWALAARGSMAVGKQALLHDALADDYIGGVEDRVGGFAVAHDPAEGDIVFHIGMQLGSAGFGGALRVNHGRQFFVIDLHGVGGVLRLIAAVGQHNRHAITDITHNIARQGGVLRLLQVAVGDEPGGGKSRQVDVCAGEDGADARHARGGGAVYGCDFGVSIGAAHDRHVQRALQFDVVGVARLASNQARVFAPFDATAEDPRAHHVPPAAASATCLTAFTML